MPPSAVLQTLARLWPRLQSSRVSVAIAGGIALSYWGNPRSTQDVDLAIHSRESDPIDDLLLESGFHPKKDLGRDLGLFHLSQWIFEPEEEYVTVEVDLMISASDYYAVALSRTKEALLTGVPIPVKVLSREDLVLHKLYAERLIDQADVASIFELHWDALDQDYLKLWSQELSLEKPLAEAVERYLGS